MIEEPKTATYWNKTVGLRMEPKTRYLAELAARAKEFSTLTDYIKWALEESFKQVTLRLPPEPDVIYGHDGSITISDAPDPEQERVADAAMSIGNLADTLWSESEFVRIETLFSIAPNRLSENDIALRNYVHSRKNLRIVSEGGYKLNRDKINSEWDSIKAAFEQTQVGK